MANNPTAESDGPAPGGGQGQSVPTKELSLAVAGSSCVYDGQTYKLNDLICDGNRQEWRCGSNSWYRTGSVCPR